MSIASTARYFQSPHRARVWLEAQRWPAGPVCSHCGGAGAYAVNKAGWYRCAEKDCRKDFSVTTGTVMERSHIPLHKWLVALYLMNSSKKGVRALQMHRSLNISYKSAWFLVRRIREAMRHGELEPLGNDGSNVEAGTTHRGPSKKGDPQEAARRSVHEARPPQPGE